MVGPAELSRETLPAPTEFIVVARTVILSFYVRPMVLLVRVEEGMVQEVAGVVPQE